MVYANIETFFYIIISVAAYAVFAWWIKHRKKEVVIVSHNCEECPFHYEYFDKENHEYLFKCTLMEQNKKYETLELMNEDCLVGKEIEISITNIK
jgi:hypothetical protein